MTSRPIIKTAQEIELMEKAGALTGKILDAVSELIRPGLITEDIDKLVHELTIASNAVPATLDYCGFPKSCCVSVNDVVCHGIPSKDLILKEGDIVNVDITSILNGYHGDASRMYFVGGAEACSTTGVQLVK